MQKKTVFENLTNKNYEGEIKKGNALKISTVENPTISDYEINKEIEYELLKGEEKTLLISQQKYFAFVVDDVIRTQSAIKLLESATLGSGYALADEIDKYIVSLIPTKNKPLQATSSDLNKMLLDIVSELDKNNAPENDRFIVLNPSISNKVMSEFAEKITDNRDVIENGYLGRIYGLNLYKSNNVNIGVYGSKSGITFAKQIDKTETLRSEKKFADAVRGLCVYGGLVTNDALFNSISFG